MLVTDLSIRSFGYCHKTIKKEFINELKKQIKEQFGENPIENKNYGKIINEKHFERLINLIEIEKVVFGAKN